jgi:chemotaxis protein methyltransferase CheR
VNAEDFNLLKGILKERSGLALSEDKHYLLESRLMPVARKLGMAGLDDLIRAIRTERKEALLRDVTEAMTTNESYFFRDNQPFDQFRELTLPALVKERNGSKRIRIWSAACSTGQEPYSLAMILKDETARLAGWRVEIVATDISNATLEKAKVGLYSQFEVQRGLPIQFLMKNFKQVDEMWQIDPSIRAMVTFKQFNLLDGFASLGAFDVIFCRNVLIYFESETKRQVLDKMGRCMPKDGVLFLGGAETVLGVTDTFTPIQGQRGVYRLVEQTPQ